jgi:hypothetical protein
MRKRDNEKQELPELEHLKSLKENLKSLNKTRGFYENTKYK